MDPIVVHFQPAAALTVDAVLPRFEHAVRISGGEAVCTWAFERSGYAVIDDRGQQALQIVADHAPVSVLEAARLEIRERLLPASTGIAGLADFLPTLLSGPIVFPSTHVVSPLLSIPPQAPPLIICTCSVGIHPLPYCS